MYHLGVRSIGRFGFGLVVVLLGLLPQVIEAASPTSVFSISPASGSFAKGSTFTIAITEDSGTAPVNAVQADLSYNPSQLEIMGIDTGSSAFDIQARQTSDSGKISLVRAKLQTPLTGSQLIGSVTFKVLGNSGSTSLSIAPTSAIEQAATNQNIWSNTVATGRYTMVANGVQTHSSTSSFGSPTQHLLAIQVVHGNRLVPAAKVTIDGTLSALTDSTGIASFYSLKPAVHSVTATALGQTVIATVTVKPGSASSLQHYKLQLGPPSYPLDILWYVALLILTVIFTGIWMSRRKSRP